MIVWTINRMCDSKDKNKWGPYVCYKSFGKDLCKPVATDANNQL